MDMSSGEIGIHVRHSGRRKNSAIAGIGLAIVTLLLSVPQVRPAELRKQYWATSLSGAVEDGIMRGLYDAVARGEVGWLDIDLIHFFPQPRRGINLILYHVGGNCYIGSDCDRFPSSHPTGDRWGSSEREIDLADPAVRRIVVADLVGLVRRGDAVAPADAIVGVHLDNVHRLDAAGLADVFNEFLRAVETARSQGSIPANRRVGYVAKNNPRGFREALTQKLLDALPLYQINENARLREDGELNGASRVAQEIGRRCGIPVFLKTFGSDVAYTLERGSERTDVHVSQEMARRMARSPDISGVAWSADESKYHPTLFVQGSPAPGPHVSSDYACRD
jgi:hypothetical protein